MNLALARLHRFGLTLASVAAITACGTTVEPPETVQSEKPRDTNPLLPGTALSTGVAANTDFAIAIYQQMRLEEQGNIVFSPYSISSAFGMVYGGARTQTEDQIARVLKFSPQAQQHPIFNKLDLELHAREPAVGNSDFLQLHTVNDLWGQKNHPFLPDFLDVLAVNYGAGMRVMDFLRDPEGSRAKINEWIAMQTAGRIEDLLPEGSVTDATKLVLTNAIYFKAKWLKSFDAAKTRDAPFTLLDGTKKDSSFMYLEDEKFGYADGDGWTAIALPYKGEQLSMLIILPDVDNFTKIEQALDRSLFEQVAGSLSQEIVQLHLPKFQHDFDINLIPTLQNMGMQAPFADADFSGIDGTRDLLITGVVHKAFIDVNEDGTEAAAATGIVVGVTSVPPPPTEMKIDRPFIYAIRDIPTGSILFLGRVLDPQP